MRYNLEDNAFEGQNVALTFEVADSVGDRQAWSLSPES